VCVDDRAGHKGRGSGGGGAGGLIKQTDEAIKGPRGTDPKQREERSRLATTRARQRSQSGRLVSRRWTRAR